MQMFDAWKQAFDRIILIHHAGYAERESIFQLEIDRVGIDRHMLSIVYGIDSPFIDGIRNTAKVSCDKLRNERGYFQCSFNHYQAWKIAQMSGWRRVLVLEDDSAFLKDLSRIQNLLADIPSSADVVLFDKWCFGNPSGFKKYMSSCSGNYCPLNKKGFELFSAACYSLSAKACAAFAVKSEACVYGADHLWNYGMFDDELEMYVSSENLAIQRTFRDRNCGFINANMQYALIGTDVKLYNL